MILSLILSGLILIASPSADDVSSSPADSLEKVLAGVKKDDFENSNKILIQLYDIYLAADLPKALSTAFRQYELATKKNDIVIKAESCSRIGNVFYLQGKNDSSLIFLNQAVSVYRNNSDRAKEIPVLNNIANVFRVTAHYDTAMVLYTDLLKYYESENDLLMQGKILGNIGSLYYTAGNQQKATEYSLKSLEIQRKTNDKRGMAISLVNLSVFSLNDGDFAGGIKYGDEALGILKDIDKNYYAAALIRVGYCYYMINQKDKALDYTRSAIDIYKQNNNIRGMMEAYRQEGDYLIESGRYAEARKSGLEALHVADTTNRLDMRLLYDLLKRTAIYLNLPEEALHFSREQLRMKEADLNDEWAIKIAEADAKYNSEKKELEIATLRVQHRSQLILIISLLLLLSGGIIIAYFIYKNQKQRQLLSAQKIKELEQEREIASTRALLDGEAAERARVSRDLHDGLGGMLSVAKLKIATMKGNLTIPEENVTVLNSAIDLLDTSIRELRRVAHNLMPESLMKYGLNAALADFCRSTEKVTYHFFGDDRRIDERTEIATYRIINELVNNSIKYSEAININVQLLITDSRIHAIVEDDGKGFDSSLIEKEGGSGLKNIRSRVNSLNGKFELITSPGKGTEVNVEFSL